MLKITKKMLNDFKETKKIVKSAKNNHNKNIDSIIEIMKPYVLKIYEEKKYKCHKDFTGIDFCNDEYMDNAPVEWEWTKISEKKIL